MDPISQATLGAVAAAVCSRQDTLRRAVVVGMLAGAAPDLDIFIRSAEDPLFNLQYHRHFTHSLLFAPVVGLIIAGLLKAVFFWKQWKFRELLLFATAGALTHGLLDACTSYGTLLYLPFSNHRESWDIISIIDPLFTGPVLLLILFAFAWKRPLFAKGALAICVLYLVFGISQRERAETYLYALAESRGHDDLREVTVRPSFANTVLWRMVYRKGDRYHVDAVWVFPFKEARFYEGGSVDAFTEEDASLLAPEGSTLKEDFERFRFFSQGYLYEYKNRGKVIGDLRYSIFPNSIEPLWGIRFDQNNPEAHVQMAYFRDASAPRFRKLWRMIRAKDLAE